MSTTLTNSNLTQIAVKRLSGKAMTNSNSAIPAEKFGSTIQSSATTIFGQSVPNNPSTASADLYRIQSASNGGPGTVQLVTFDVVAIGSEYANTNDSNLYSDEVAVGADTGDSYGVTTYHAYALKLTGSYEADVVAFGGSTYFADNASTPKVLGTDPEFSNNFISTGSTQFQIVPEYLSTVAGTTNPYIPIVSNTSGDDFYDPAGFISPTDGIDYYLDTFAGILFVQDPAQYGTPDSNGASPNSGATIPKRVRAFLYTGKYQSEIEGGNFHISGSTGGGFSVAGQVTASFETGSGDGLSITVTPNSNLLTFQLENVASGSTLFHIDSSEADDPGFSVTPNSGFTASFESGSAGITVKTNGTNIVSIGDNDDNVQFANITGSNLLITGTASIALFHSEYVSSSIIYESGSTKFGDTQDDNHRFTGSLYLSGSTFGWDKPTGNASTVPLVYDSATGTIHTGSAFSTSEGIYISASDGNGFSILSAASASLTTGSTSGDGLTITVGAEANDIEFTLVNVVSGSGQILDGTGILSSSTQDFATYSSSVETLISDATASILANETSINILIDSASGGLHFSSSGDPDATNNPFSLSLLQTASFIGGDGIQVDIDSGVITISSDYGELDSALHISASDGNGTSLAYTATASFSASGPGLTATLDVSEINYDINANTLIEAVDTATVINITASYAESASVATSASYALSSSYAVTASYAENAGSVSLTEETNSTAILGVVFSNLEDDVLKTDGQVNESVTLQGASSLGFVPSIDRPQLFVSGGTGTTTHTVIENNAIGSDATTYSILTSANNTTINVGTPAGTVFFKGSASIDGDLIVKGQTTTLNTQNLLVEDQFILLSSGSYGNDGGIVVERSQGGIGTALFWDETNDVWAIDKEGVDANTATTANADVVVVSVSSSAANPTGNPALGATADYRYGQMYISTTDNDGDGNQIWIFAP